MPAKKVAKKAAKKVAKKAAKKSARHSQGRDLRRAYEHLGRVEVLDALAGKKLDEISTVVGLAQQELSQSAARNGAELLRAAEHLAFAALARQQPPSRLSPELEGAIAEEFEDLLRRASKSDLGGRKLGRAGRDESGLGQLTSLIAAAITEARDAFAQRAFRPALELARAAEALTHVEEPEAGQGRLGAGHASGSARLRS